MRDANRSLVYDVEDRLTTAMDNNAPLDFYGSRLILGPDRKFGDIASVQRYLRLIRAREWGFGDTPEPIVTAARSERRATWVAPASITLPEARWALRETTVLHEYAHHVTYHYDGESAHSAQFCRRYTELVRNAVGPEAATLLMAGFDQAGLYRIG